MEKLGKTTKYLSQRSRCSGEGSIPVPPEFKSKLYCCSNYESIFFSHITVLNITFFF